VENRRYMPLGATAKFGTARFRSLVLAVGLQGLYGVSTNQQHADDGAAADAVHSRTSYSTDRQHRQSYLILVAFLITPAEAATSKKSLQVRSRNSDHAPPSCFMVVGWVDGKVTDSRVD